MAQNELRFPLRAASSLIDQLYSEFTAATAACFVAGSARRRAETIKDIEFVLIPRPQEFAVKMREMESTGTLQHFSGCLDGEKLKTRYAFLSDRQGEAGAERIKVEIHIVVPGNFGNILWLRTGPADANEYIMRILKNHRASVRHLRGYFWIVSYPKSYSLAKDNVIYQQRLRLADERAVFERVLGIEFIPPPARSVESYRSAFAHKKQSHPQGHLRFDAPRELIIHEPTQGSLF